MIIRYFIFIIILCGISVSKSYRILGIFPFPGRSHFHVLEPVAKTLAQRGHQVDVISHFKLKKPFPNYTELEFSATDPHARLEFTSTYSSETMRVWAAEICKKVCNVLSHPTVAKLIKNPPTNPPYDAVIVHAAIGTQCLNAIGYILDVPVIGVATTMAYAINRRSIGDPLNLAISPGHTFSYKQNLTFWERVKNLVDTHNQLRSFDSHHDIENYYIKKYLGLDSSHYEELKKNFALFLTNSHHSFYGIKPKTPALIEIGGMHIKNDSSELDLNLKKILDESINGFVYFSFGTLAAVETLPVDFLDKLFTTFRKISPVRVIMRAPNPSFVPKNLSDNVFMFDWLPQQKILEHSNIKAFATHGGGLSTQETIHYAVPAICIPIFADQQINCDIISMKNMGVKINIRTSNQRDFDNAFQNILSDSKYRESMKKFSILHWDRPQSPQESVNYWVEYVIRHGKNVLRSPAVDLEWWQFELIDVYLFLFSCSLIAIFLSIIIIGYTFRLIVRVFKSVNFMYNVKLKSN